ncbi:MAG: hypothetical protein GF309_12695 [Candidatus Lokiarchaeota archaeon]|nr:hypothetical protein [Candidatus Lokiarchaeota archaeon]
MLIELSDLLDKTKASLPKTEGELGISGLEEDVEIIRDRFGVPHIYAENLNDLFLAQGYVTAQDRLWQMELTRRTVKGTMSEIVGEAMLKSDLFYRNIGLNRIAQRLAHRIEEKKTDEHIEMLDSYGAGINQYISHNEETLPIGYELLQFSPEEFTAQDQVLVLLGLSFGLSATNFFKFIRFKLIEKFGEKTASILFPPGKTPSFAGQSEHDFLTFVQNSIGSNNWVISGEKSITGKPLLANDPHLMHTIPGIWYENHLNAPDLNVTGFTVAGLPGITVGHNGHIGWGYTNSFADVQDLYIEKVNPQNPQQYRSNGKWIDFETAEETIDIRGKEAFHKEFLLSEHGPILESYPVSYGDLGFLEIDEKYKLAHRGIENEVDISEVFAAFLLLNKAKNWNEFKNAVKHWTLPSQNIVYADAEGNIGYRMSGKIPIRKRGQGVVPVPGWNEEYEWDGYIPFEEMPQSFNPETQLIATANNKVVPPDYPYFISHYFLYPYRSDRIIELLLEKQKLGVEDFKRIQLDLYSRIARKICQYLTNIEPRNERQAEALEILKKWDYHVRVDSGAALIYHVWITKFLELVFKERLGKKLFTLFMNGAANTLHFLKYPSRWLYPEESQSNVENRDRALSDSLDMTLGELTEKHGDDMESWRWGLQHHLTFVHPLSKIHPDLKILNRGPFEVPGDFFTLNAFWNASLEENKCNGGVTMRMILDFSDLSKSVAVAPPGQSGHPLSEHYGDMIEPWLNGEYHQMLFTREDIERDPKATLVLRAT